MKGFVNKKTEKILFQRTTKEKKQVNRDVMGGGGGGGGGGGLDKQSLGSPTTPPPHPSPILIPFMPDQYYSEHPQL